MNDKEHPKQCAFCDSNANSREHIWPQWMHPMLTEPVGPQSHVKLVMEPSSSPAFRRRCQRQGTLKTNRVRSVCRECNSGWMNRIETSSRGILEKIVAGENVALSQKDQERLSQWIMMKVFVMEHEYEYDLSLKEERAAFAKNQVIPPYYHIFLSKHKSVSSMFRDRATGSPLNKDGSACYTAPMVSVATVGLFIGRAFVYVTGSRTDSMDPYDLINPSIFKSLAHLWPITNIPFQYSRVSFSEPVALLLCHLLSSTLRAIKSFQVERAAREAGG